MGDLVKDLRDMADFLESHPELPRPLVGAQFDVFVETKEDLARCCRIMGIGVIHKNVIDRWFFVTKYFGCLRFDVNCARNIVCEKKLIGQRTIPTQIIPEHQEDIVEWECPESLLEGMTPRKDGSNEP